MKFAQTLLITMAAMLLGGFAANDIRHDMVKLDKVYIAALALTSQGKAAESRKAVDALQKEWQAFSSRHNGANPRDSQWLADFHHIGEMIAQAAAIAASGEKITNAHEALEHVREVLMTLRQRNRIGYYIDGLTAFHEPMEAIVLAAKDKTAETLTEADIARIRTTLPLAEEAWRRVAAARLDADDYLLSSSQADGARTLIALESASLRALQDALDTGEKARIAQAAVAIKPNFAKLFMTFGDFTPYGS